MKSSLLIALLPAAGLSLATEAPEVLSQQEFGKMACGPCAFVNSLLQAGDKTFLDHLNGRNSLDKARDFASRFGTAPSVVYDGRRTCYSDENGTANLDLLDMINRMREEYGREPLVGEYLRRRETETPAEFVRRVECGIQDSIAAGFPPILILRSARADGKDQGGFEWNGILGHWICVSSIMDPGTEEPLRVLKFADSLRGETLTGLLHAEPRQATVQLDFKVDESGKEIWNWIPGGDCLFLNAPSMPLGTEQAEWHQRTYVAANYLIRRVPPTR